MRVCLFFVCLFLSFFFFILFFAYMQSKAGPKKGADASVEGLVRTLISQINNSDWLEHNPPTGEVIFVPEATAKAPGPTTFSMSMLTPQQRQLMERIEANHLSSMKKS